jgi:hypothetical protein
MRIFSKLDKTRDGKLDHADRVAWKVRVARRADAGCAMWRSDVAMQKYDDYLAYLDAGRHDPSDPRFDGHRGSGSGPTAAVPPSRAHDRACRSTALTDHERKEAKASWDRRGQNGRKVVSHCRHCSAHCLQRLCAQVSARKARLAGTGPPGVRARLECSNA